MPDRSSVVRLETTAPAASPRLRTLRKAGSIVLRGSALTVSSLLAALIITAAMPPIVADQSDRAVVNAPITLITAPISGEIDNISLDPGSNIVKGATLAAISNSRVDRSTLLLLEEKAADTRGKLTATRAKKESDKVYLEGLDSEIASQLRQMRAHLHSQIEELRARLAQSRAQSDEKKALVDRQSKMVARDTASPDMVRPTIEQYTAALYNADAEAAKLAQKMAQVEALERGVYVGEDLVPIHTLEQKGRDIRLDAARMEIEENELAAALLERERLIAVERDRLDRLSAADILAPSSGKVWAGGASVGRHVSAGDTVATVLDCGRQFVVAIFSYRQGAEPGRGNAGTD